MNNFLRVPAGSFAVQEDDEVAAQKRREIAERLRRGQVVPVTNTGLIISPNDPQATDEMLVVPPWQARRVVLLVRTEPDAA
ncbi:MAG: hypothetical protein FWB78_08105 [Treponema sp.]|nr:hypothetical protein [Treponema sp.]